MEISLPLLPQILPAQQSQAAPEEPFELTKTILKASLDLVDF